MIESPNPVLLVGRRGPGVEVLHRGAFCVARGRELVEGGGDADAPSFLRSAAKFFQALPALALGVEGRFGLGDREIALMCASHGGEAEHLEVARGILARGGFDETALRCGPHPPMHGPSAARMLVGGEVPGPLHNNCSGKHGGMILAALAAGEDPGDYHLPEHPRQAAIRETVAELAGLEAGALRFGTDGCGVPTFFLPLGAAARAFGALAAGELPAALRGPASRIVEALRREPMMIAGRDRFCSAVIRATGGRAIVKVGADGYYGGIVPDLGLGFALHLDDGGRNASERVVGALLEHLGVLGGPERDALGPWLDPRRRNCAGDPVGVWETALTT